MVKDLVKLAAGYATGIYTYDYLLEALGDDESLVNKVIALSGAGIVAGVASSVVSDVLDTASDLLVMLDVMPLILVGNRRSGKTTSLINLAKSTGGILLVNNWERAKFIRPRYKYADFHIGIVQQLLDGELIVDKRQIYIDESTYFLEKTLENKEIMKRLFNKMAEDARIYYTIILKNRDIKELSNYINLLKQKMFPNLVALSLDISDEI